MDSEFCFSPDACQTCSRDPSSGELSMRIVSSREDVTVALLVELVISLRLLNHTGEGCTGVSKPIENWPIEEVET